ncbi:hypothetical protein PI125_g12065 [Phytophthora idaei]|nr:hypothetical protein PI125_g12065 [Phytophthora idaei]
MGCGYVPQPAVASTGFPGTLPYGSSTYVPQVGYSAWFQEGQAGFLNQGTD